MTYAAQTSDVKALNDFVASDPAALQKLADDPRSVLAGFGLDIDDETTDALTRNLKGRKALDASAQAAVVHIDV